MVFAKEANAGLTSVVKKVESTVEKNKAADLRGVVIVNSDAKDLEEKLKKVAESEKIEKTVLAIDNPGGQEQFKLSSDADVTIVLYVKKQVKATHAFKGTLTEKDFAQALADLPKILPEKKSD